MPAPGPPRLGRYQLLERLGAGGTAEVFVARIVRGPDRGREVALRRLRQELGRDEARRHQLLKEGELARGLRHPLFCAVYELGELEGLPFLTLELVKGPSLRRMFEYQRLRGRSAPLAAVLEVACQLCAGLDHAHLAPFHFVHGDISPANLLLDRGGQVKLVDSLCATPAAPCGHQGSLAPGEVHEEVQGTLGYLAPEQLDGAPPSPASDLYACAVILWELLSSRRLFDAATLRDAIRSRRRPIPPVPGRGGRIAATLERALSSEPARRFGNGASLQRALLQEGETVGADRSRAALGEWIAGVFPDSAPR